MSIKRKIQIKYLYQKNPPPFLYSFPDGSKGCEITKYLAKNCTELKEHFNREIKEDDIECYSEINGEMRNLKEYPIPLEQGAQITIRSSGLDNWMIEVDRLSSEVLQLSERVREKNVSQLNYGIIMPDKQKENEEFDVAIFFSNPLKTRDKLNTRTVSSMKLAEILEEKIFNNKLFGRKAKIFPATHILITQYQKTASIVQIHCDYDWSQKMTTVVEQTVYGNHKEYKEFGVASQSKFMASAKENTNYVLVGRRAVEAAQHLENKYNKVLNIFAINSINFDTDILAQQLLAAFYENLNQKENNSAPSKESQRLTLEKTLKVKHDQYLKQKPDQKICQCLHPRSAENTDGHNKDCQLLEVAKSIGWQTVHELLHSNSLFGSLTFDNGVKCDCKTEEQRKQIKKWKLGKNCDFKFKTKKSQGSDPLKMKIYKREQTDHFHDDVSIFNNSVQSICQTILKAINHQKSATIFLEPVTKDIFGSSSTRQLMKSIIERAVMYLVQRKDDLQMDFLHMIKELDTRNLDSFKQDLMLFLNGGKKAWSVYYIDIYDQSGKHDANINKFFEQIQGIVQKLPNSIVFICQRYKDKRSNPKRLSSELQPFNKEDVYRAITRLNFTKDKNQNYDLHLSFFNQKDLRVDFSSLEVYYKGFTQYIDPKIPKQKKSKKFNQKLRNMVMNQVKSDFSKLQKRMINLQIESQSFINTLNYLVSSYIIENYQSIRKINQQPENIELPANIKIEEEQIDEMKLSIWLFMQNFKHGITLKELEICNECFGVPQINMLKNLISYCSRENQKDNPEELYITLSTSLDPNQAQVLIKPSKEKSYKNIYDNYKDSRLKLNQIQNYRRFSIIYLSEFSSFLLKQCLRKNIYSESLNQGSMLSSAGVCHYKIQSQFQHFYDPELGLNQMENDSQYKSLLSRLDKQFSQYFSQKKKGSQAQIFHQLIEMHRGNIMEFQKKEEHFEESQQIAKQTRIHYCKMMMNIPSLIKVDIAYHKKSYTFINDSFCQQSKSAIKAVLKDKFPKTRRLLEMQLSIIDLGIVREDKQDKAQKKEKISQKGTNKTLEEKSGRKKRIMQKIADIKKQTVSREDEIEIAFNADLWITYIMTKFSISQKQNAQIYLYIEELCHMRYWLLSLGHLFRSVKNWYLLLARTTILFIENRHKYKDDFQKDDRLQYLQYVWHRSVIIHELKPCINIYKDNNAHLLQLRTAMFVIQAKTQEYKDSLQKLQKISKQLDQIGQRLVFKNVKNIRKEDTLRSYFKLRQEISHRLNSSASKAERPDVLILCVRNFMPYHQYTPFSGVQSFYNEMAKAMQLSAENTINKIWAQKLNIKFDKLTLENLQESSRKSHMALILFVKFDSERRKVYVQTKIHKMSPFQRNSVCNREDWIKDAISIEEFATELEKCLSHTIIIVGNELDRLLHYLQKDFKINYFKRTFLWINLDRICKGEVSTLEEYAQLRKQNCDLEKIIIQFVRKGFCIKSEKKGVQDFVKQLKESHCQNIKVFVTPNEREEGDGQHSQQYNTLENISKRQVKIKAMKEQFKNMSIYEILRTLRRSPLMSNLPQKQIKQKLNKVKEAYETNQEATYEMDERKIEQINTKLNNIQERQKKAILEYLDTQEFNVRAEPDSLLTHMPHCDGSFLQKNEYLRTLRYNHQTVPFMKQLILNKHIQLTPASQEPDPQNPEQSKQHRQSAKQRMDWLLISLYWQTIFFDLYPGKVFYINFNGPDILEVLIQIKREAQATKGMVISGAQSNLITWDYLCIFNNVSEYFFQIIKRIGLLQQDNVQIVIKMEEQSQPKIQSQFYQYKVEALEAKDAQFLVASWMPSNKVESNIEKIQSIVQSDKCMYKKVSTLQKESEKDKDIFSKLMEMKMVESYKKHSTSKIKGISLFKLPE